MINLSRNSVRTIAMIGVALITVSFAGCFGAMAQLMYVIKGYDTPAAYSDLEEKRVAVVCVSDASAYGPDVLTDTVARALGLKLGQGVKKINLIPHAAIEDWIDQNGWDETDFGALGRGVGAERVVAIEIASYSIHEGPTIYKGRANITVTVHDLTNTEGSQVAFVYGPEDFSFPKNGRPSIHSDDRQFEAFFLSRLTQKIANQFVKHDRLDSFADDAMDY